MLLTQLLADEILDLRRSGPQGPEGDRVIRLAERAARASGPILIEGEPGTGADALARAIHECSDRKGRPFIRVHAGGPGEEMGSALFGLDRGAGGRQPGHFAQANGGTLLIQGVEELGLDLQVALLKAVQDGEIQPLGGKRPQRVDVRVIATAPTSLIERVRRGLFREDLYYRLHVLPITLPSLRTRREAIPALAEAFLARFAAEEGKPVIGLAPDVPPLLCAYDWPGNVRQLENAVYRAVALAEGPLLTPAEFPQIAAQVSGSPIVIPPLPPASSPVREVVRIEVRDPHTLSLLDEAGEIRRLDALEAEIIRFALEHYRGHMSAVSRHLGIGRSTLYRKLKDLGLENVSADAAA